MLQKNHHFFFAETYFGSFQDFEEELFDDEDETLDEQKPWTLVLDVNNTLHFQQKIGLFIHWTDDLS